FRGDDKMKSATENEITGQVHEVNGKIKEKAGELTNNPDLEADGIIERIAGKIQNKIGRVARAVEKS
ncbi:MAG: CsbD family protein, partial [Candidatus Acidiferrales bacterium]